MDIRAAMLAGAILTGAAVVTPVAARAAPAGSAGMTGQAAGSCTSTQILAWVGLSGRAGSARGVAVPLEFSNIGRTACSVSGYPGVLAVGPGGRPVAPRAGRRPGTRPHRFTLDPGQTAHAVLTIGIARASCRTAIAAAGVRITPPGTRAAQRIGLVFRVCARHRTLLVGPLLAGTGIP